MLSVFLKQEVSLAPCATYSTPNHPSVNQQGRVVELEPGLNFTAAIMQGPFRGGGTKKKEMERQKEVSFPQKQMNKNQQSSRILYFSISLKKVLDFFVKI